MKKTVFTDNINMETQTVFKMDGRIDIFPCDFEMGQHIVSGSRKAHQRGRMVTDDDGTSHFMPYARHTGPRFEILREVKHGKLMANDVRLVAHISVPFSDADPYNALLQCFIDCVKPTREVVRKINERMV